MQTDTETNGISEDNLLLRMVKYTETKCFMITAQSNPFYVAKI